MQRNRPVFNCFRFKLMRRACCRPWNFVLPEDDGERERLRNLLAELVGGKTLVLLGSRSDESWLAGRTFADSAYELPGLDEEAASQLADAILQKHKASHYRKDADFVQLLKLLDGYPLALEVVLPNLARQKPSEVLEALVTGDEIIDPGDRQEKTENIVR